jgi:GT2 family glycosyltransferase
VSAIRGLGAAILAYEPDHRILATVEALTTGAATPEHVVIANNGGEAPALTAIRSQYPDVVFVDLLDNPGYGAGMNAAADRLLNVGSEILLFLTQETVLQPSALGRLCEALATDPDLALVAPLLLRLSDLKVVWSTGGRLTRWRRRPVHAGSGQPVELVHSVGVRRCEWVDGACMAIRASDFASVGGFRPDLFLYWEDVDICLRLRDKGRSIAVVDTARAAQEPSMTPPYLDSRNKALVLGWHGRAGVLVDVAIRGAADVLRGRGLRRSGLMINGLRDAKRGGAVLDRTQAMERP